MGDGRWAMGDGRWAMGDGRCKDFKLTNLSQENTSKPKQKQEYPKKVLLLFLNREPMASSH